MRSKLPITSAVVIGKAKVIYYLAVFCLVIFWLTIAFTRANFNRLDLHGFIVQSRSMEPVLSPGSLVIVKPKPSYSPGDVVTFTLKDNPDKNPTTHRIFKIINWHGQTMFATKGDANTIVDNQLISQDEIVGKTIYRIPYLGMFIYVSQTKIGSFVYIILPAVIIILVEIKNIVLTFKNKKRDL